MRKFFVTGLVLFMIFGLAMGVLAISPPPENDIVDTAINSCDFTILVTAIGAVEGLEDVLRGDGPFTVFAPTDSAFENLPEGALDWLLDNPILLESILLHHVVEGAILAEDLVDGEVMETLRGQNVTVTINEGTFIDDSQVIEADILCSNGVIHIIDDLLYPETDIIEELMVTTLMQDDANTVLAAIEAAGLVDTLRGPGPFTLFVPVDEAFEALPEGLLESLLEDTESLRKVLLYHALPGRIMAEDLIGLDGQDVETIMGQDVRVTIDGERVYINSAEVIITDIECFNGVIHGLDAVLVPDLEEEEDPGELPRTGGNAGLILAGLMLAGSGLLMLKTRKS